MPCQRQQRQVLTPLPTYAMKHILSTLALSVLLLPGTVHAYVEPEDVLFGNEDTISTDDTLHGAASSAPSSRAASSAVSSEETHPAAPDTGLTPEEQRILRRIENRNNAPAPADTTGQAEVLHSGAPLAHSGPETGIAVALLAVAIATTVRFARAGRIDVMQK